MAYGSNPAASGMGSLLPGITAVVPVKLLMGERAPRDPLDTEIFWDREEPSALVMTNLWGALAMEYFKGRFSK